MYLYNVAVAFKMNSILAVQHCGKWHTPYAMWDTQEEDQRVLLDTLSDMGLLVISLSAVGKIHLGAGALCTMPAGKDFRETR